VRGLPESRAKWKDNKWGKPTWINSAAAMGWGYVQCENGHVYVPDYGSAAAFDKDGKMVQRFGSFPAPKTLPIRTAGQQRPGSHHQNWITGVRTASRRNSTRKSSMPPEQRLCHTGNISYRSAKSRRPVPSWKK